MFLSLIKVLEKASTRTQAKKDALMEKECVAMISPTIQRKRVDNVDYYWQWKLQCSVSNLASIVDLNPVIPNFSRVKVQDCFKALVYMFIKNKII